MFSFIEKLLSGMLPEKTIRSYIYQGASEAYQLLIDSGHIKPAATRRGEQAKERAQVEATIRQSCENDIAVIAKAATKQEQLLALRESTMGAVRSTELASEVTEQLHNGISLGRINAAIGDDSIRFSSNSEADKHFYICICKEFCLFKLRDALGDAKANDWTDMYRDVVRSTIRQRIHTEIHSKRNYMTSEPVSYPYMLSRLDGSQSTLEYVTKEVRAGAQLKYNKETAKQAVREMQGSVR